MNIKNADLEMLISVRNVLMLHNMGFNIDDKVDDCIESMSLLIARLEDSREQQRAKTRDIMNTRRKTDKNYGRSKT